MNNDVIIRILDLPDSIEGVTVPSDDGYYNVYINSRYTKEYQRKILKHELEHVNNFDFDNFDDINLCELRANGELVI